jgi:hypothetical protein
VDAAAVASHIVAAVAQTVVEEKAAKERFGGRVVCKISGAQPGRLKSGRRQKR